MATFETTDVPPALHANRDLHDLPAALLLRLHRSLPLQRFHRCRSRPLPESLLQQQPRSLLRRLAIQHGLATDDDDRREHSPARSSRSLDAKDSPAAYARVETAEKAHAAAARSLVALRTLLGTVEYSRYRATNSPAEPARRPSEPVQAVLRDLFRLSTATVRQSIRAARTD